MSAWFGSESERPPAPSGMGGSSSGAPRGEKGLAPFEQRDSGGRFPASRASGLFFCALGGAVATSSMSLVAPAFIAYGLSPLAPRAPRERLACLAVTLVPALALSAPMGLPTALAVLVSCLVAFVAGELVVRGALTPGASCVLVALFAAAHLGCDALATAAYGTTVPAVVDAALVSYEEQLGASAFLASSQLQLIRDLVALFWPVAYVTAAFGECLFALLGVSLASGGEGSKDAGSEDGHRPRTLRLAEFDLPLWVVAVFVASLAGLAVAATVTGDVIDVVLMVSANVAMSVRLALAVQGLAVLVWLLRAKGVGRPASALVCGVALYLEVQFVVLTVAGLVDFWANFRRLPRGGAGPKNAGATAAQD